MDADTHTNQHLHQNWGQGVDLYSINVPLVPGISARKILYTRTLQNYWEQGSSFEEVEVEASTSPEGREQQIREGGEGYSGARGVVEVGDKGMGMGRGHRHRHFRWAPRFADVKRSVEESGEGNDGRAVMGGFVR